jgi:hypothetical protein
MRAFFDSELDAIADEEDVAEFRRGVAAIGEDHRRVLQILIPKLIALQERGDSAGALALIATIKAIVGGGDGPLH